MKIETGRRRGAFRTAPTLVATMLFAAWPAYAVLGGDVSTIADDQVRLGGTRHAATIAGVAMRTHEITLADGSSVREFVTPSGLVFAVAWSTRFKPDLASLLGVHADAYAAAAAETLKQPGIRRHVVLRRGDLVVHAAAHLNTHVGRAWLQSLVPQGVGVDALR